MPNLVPSILILAGDPRERHTLASLVTEAGLRPVLAADAADALAAMSRGGCDVAVLALADSAARAFLDHAAVFSALAPVVAVVDRGAAPLDCEHVVAVARPLEPREVIGAVIELILEREEESASEPQGGAAEFGIAAARLACLCMRQASAVASGGGRLAQELSRQIADLTATAMPIEAAAFC